MFRAALLLLVCWAGGERSASAQADLVRGQVERVDLEQQILVIRDAETGRLRNVYVAPGSEVALVRGGKIPISQVEPGALVSIQDTVYASKLRVGDEHIGTIRSVARNRIVLTEEPDGKDISIPMDSSTVIKPRQGLNIDLSDGLLPGSRVVVVQHGEGVAERVVVEHEPASMLHEFWDNFRHNLFKPLLLFFYMGFLIPILRVKFEFPYVMYQALTIFLLIAIGWHGGEELAHLPLGELSSAAGFMLVGFFTNTCIGLIAYFLLSIMTGLRRIDRATVAGYYGSDSAGTFVTCLGVLTSAGILYQAHMPVMLAVMEIPGCLVALYLVSRLRNRGMDPAGTMPDEPGYDPEAQPRFASGMDDNGGADHGHADESAASRTSEAYAVDHVEAQAIEEERELALEKRDRPTKFGPRPKGGLSGKLLHEVFLNPGLYLLFGGILIGFLSGLQGPEVTRADDNFFVDLFQGILCLFLLEMGMTASRKLKDLRTAGPGFVAFALLAPNLFALIGISVAHLYSHASGTQLELGTYVLFSVLCAAASYIAVPAVQRLAIPEASPTLPLAASLGLTFSYNVTIGIPIYIEIAKQIIHYFPVGS